MRRRGKWILGIAVAGLALTVGVLSLRPGVYMPAHRHCIKFAGMELVRYAQDHDGRFPTHPSGYGDALLLLDEESWASLTGPGYNTSAFQEAKATGRGLPEALCGRVYIQGLSRRSSPTVAVLFDKLATPGGDHCHLPMRLVATRGREVLFIDGHFEFVPDADWPAFAERQVDLLVSEGVRRDEAERLYAQASR